MAWGGWCNEAAGSDTATAVFGTVDRRGRSARRGAYTGKKVNTTHTAYGVVKRTRDSDRERDKGDNTQNERKLFRPVKNYSR